MDQQFRLKWNNHCNTLLQVFGNLLKTETLVDCTIGADGQYLKAHKVVVSACSPYFQSLFTEHFDKHPIIILKDIKFAELQSMIDYMYEGEVNISQDQLPSFLKAAASIQLKGLTQNVKSEAAGGPGGGAAPHSPPASNKPPVPSLNSASRGGMLSNGSLTPSSMLNVELEEGQQRKKRKLGGGPPAEPSSASSSPSLLVPDLVTPSVILDVPGETPGGAQNGQGGGGQGGGNNEAAGGGGHMKKEPSEYSGRSEDEEEDGMSHDGWDLSNDGLHDSNSTMSAGDRGGQGGPGGLHHSTPGGHRPSGGPGGLAGAGGPDMSNVDENNQGYLMSLYPPYTEEVMRHECHQCGRSYKWRSSLKSHLQNECGKEPRFHCPHCPYRCKVRSNLFKHLRNYHKTYIAPLKKHSSSLLSLREWRRQQLPDMLSMNPPQPLPYNLSKPEKIESSPLISSYGPSPYNTPYNLSAKDKGSPPPQHYNTAYNLSSKPEKIESSPLIASYTGTGHTNTVTSSPSGVGFSPNHGGDFASPNHAPGGGFASPNSAGGFTSPNSGGGFASPNSAGGGFSTPSPTGSYPMHSPSHPYGGPISPPASVPGSPSAKSSLPSPPPYQSSPSPSH